ncbi:MAG: hypothetical protein FWD66_04025 [Paludibacter sp.]|nr:hypothetical protein [Paludibacter sp.]
MRITLHKTINSSIPLVILWLAACLFVWFLPAKTTYQSIDNQNVLPAVIFLHSIFPTPSNLANIICLILAIFNGFLLYYLNNVFDLVRQKTFVLFYIYFILISVFHSTHYNIIANLALCFLLITFFSFLKLYRNSQQTEAAFLSSFLIACIGWLFFPEFLLLFVPAWLVIIKLRAMSMRVFLATVIGLITPAIFCFALNQNYFKIFFSSFENIGLSRLTFENISINFRSFIFAIMLIIWILSLWEIYTNALMNNIRTRTNMNFILIFFISIILIIIIFPQTFYSFLPILFALFAVFFSHPVTLRTTNFYGIIFIIFCVVNIIFVLYNLISNYL